MKSLGLDEHGNLIERSEELDKQFLNRVKRGVVTGKEYGDPPEADDANKGEIEKGMTQEDVKAQKALEDKCKKDPLKCDNNPDVQRTHLMDIKVWCKLNLSKITVLFNCILVHV